MFYGTNTQAPAGIKAKQLQIVQLNEARENVCI